MANMLIAQLSRYGRQLNLRSPLLSHHNRSISVRTISPMTLLNSNIRNGPTRKFTTSKSNATESASGPMLWRSLTIFLVTGGALAVYFNLENERKKIEAKKKANEGHGKAAIGGPFKLVDLEGKECTNERFLGQWVLLYFGFTFCPDICPEELQKMTETVNILDANKKLPKVTPLFITIDPKRDTPAKLKSYLVDFHPRIVGLTGSEPAIKEAAKAYRVYYSKPDNQDEDYLVDHTIIMYLINPAGLFEAYYGQNIAAKDMAKDIQKIISVHTE